MHYIYLIRHGETDWNKEGKLQGHVDIALNEKGKEQAKQLHEMLKEINFSAIYSSDLSRAKETASIVRGSRTLEIIETPELRERSMGDWEGCKASDLIQFIKQDAPLMSEFTQESYLSYKCKTYPESFRDSYSRISRFIIRNAHTGLPILISSHGGILRSVLNSLQYQKAGGWKVDNCGYIHMKVTESGELSIIEHHGAKIVENEPILL